MAKFPVIEIRAKFTTQPDIEVVPVFQVKKDVVDSSRQIYAPELKRLNKFKVFSGAKDSSSFVRFLGKNAEGVLFVGLGSKKDADDENSRIAGGNTWKRCKSENAGTLLIHADEFCKISGQSLGKKLLKGFLEGVTLGSYEYEHPKIKKLTTKPAKILIQSSGALKADLTKMLKDVEAIWESITITRDWSNHPSNIGTPEFFANEAARISRENGIKCRVLTKNEIKKEKMELLLSVGQGSVKEPRVVVMEYSPRSSAGASKKIALVGKGVTFDTGGISIKPSAKMEEMKHDMTGAATLMGSIVLAAKRKVKNKIVCIMGFVENMPSGTATNPGDVFISRSGKSIEVINTDAEGRLVLADILDYAQDFKPNVIVDSATLTGAVIVSLGNVTCAILGNDQKSIEKLIESATEEHERIWQLPLYPEYAEELKTPYADLKNIGNGRGAGTAMGAAFLKQFIKDGTKWAHLDIAGTAWDTMHLSYCPNKGASGLHVRSVARFIEKYK